MSTAFRLQRTGDPDLVFDGDVLVDLSTREPGQTRWTEYRIYKTVSGRWVTEMLGRSAMYDEHDIRKVTVCSTPVEVRDSLRRVDKARQTTKPYLTHSALDALDEAARHDPDLEGVTEERV